MNFNQRNPNFNPYMRNVNQGFNQQYYQSQQNHAPNQQNINPQGYNPYQNQMPNSPHMMRSNMGFPLQTPKVNPGSLTRTGAATTAKGLNLGKFLTGAQNMISTVTQAVPIYQQVKPLVSNSKVITGAIKKFFSSPNKNTQTTAREVIRDPEVIDKNRARPQQKHTSTNFREQSHPNRPFF